MEKASERLYLLKQLKRAEEETSSLIKQVLYRVYKTYR
jgi:hypothetical protein